MITIKQGESRKMRILLKQNGKPLTPDLIEDLLICVGDAFRKKYSSGEIAFETDRWCIQPTQQETMDIVPDTYNICAHIRYPDGQVFIVDLDRLMVKENCCGEVF